MREEQQYDYGAFAESMGVQKLWAAVSFYKEHQHDPILIADEFCTTVKVLLEKIKNFEAVVKEKSTDFPRHADLSTCLEKNISAIENNLLVLAKEKAANKEKLVAGKEILGALEVIESACSKRKRFLNLKEDKFSRTEIFTQLETMASDIEKFTGRLDVYCTSENLFRSWSTQLDQQSGYFFNIAKEISDELRRQEKEKDVTTRLSAHFDQYMLFFARSLLRDESEKKEAIPQMMKTLQEINHCIVNYPLLQFVFGKISEDITVASFQRMNTFLTFIKQAPWDGAHQNITDLEAWYRNLSIMARFFCYLYKIIKLNIYCNKLITLYQHILTLLPRQQTLLWKNFSFLTKKIAHFAQRLQQEPQFLKTRKLEEADKAEAVKEITEINKETVNKAWYAFDVEWQHSLLPRLPAGTTTGRVLHALKLDGESLLLFTRELAEAAALAALTPCRAAGIEGTPTKEPSDDYLLVADDARSFASLGARGSSSSAGGLPFF